MNKISTQTAEHYLWGEVCEGWHLLKSPSLSVIQERMPPHSSEVRHAHQHSQQFFFVLFGVLSIEADHAIYTLHEHQGLHLAPHIPHRVYNDSEDDVMFVVISEPPSHDDRHPVGTGL